jgi:hypothetical protein
VKRTFSLCISALVLASAAAAAQNEIVAVPNRPTVSTTAQPVQPGVLETEWGVDAASSHQDINDLFKFGLTSNFELRLANILITANPGMHGLGDTAIGFKYRLTRDSGRQPSVSLMYMFTAPTATNVPGPDEPAHSFGFLASKDLGKHHFDFNLIGSLLGSPTGGFHYNFLNALAWSHPLRGKWSATAEISGVTSAQAGPPGSAEFLASAIYTPEPRLVLDIGMAERITGEIPHGMFVAGVTCSVANLYHSRRQTIPRLSEPASTNAYFPVRTMRHEMAGTASQ